MLMTRVESEALLRRITEEIWNGRRHELVDELIAEDLGILRFARGQAAERWGIGDNLTQMQQLGLLG
jgi:hypothetical protein